MNTNRHESKSNSHEFVKIRQKFMRIRVDEPLWAHTTFRIGGPAKFWAQAQDLNELKQLLDFAKESNLPIFLIGSGSNILVRDEGFDGVVAALTGAPFKCIEFKDSYVWAGGGLSLGKFCLDCARNGLSGLEHLYGIPGTVGGALAGNAGGNEIVKGIGELVEEVEVMDKNGNIKNLGKEELRFGYRSSNLTDYIILRAKFNLKRDDRPEIENKMKEVLAHKRKAQELSLPSAGCIFKNPNGHSAYASECSMSGMATADKSAGELIDKCGLKDTRVNDAAVSSKHANFIVNLGNAKAGDVLELIEVIKEKVKRDFDILLEEEIKVIG